MSKPIAAVNKRGPLAPKLTVVSAKDYVPGRENELLEGVRSLLVASTSIVNQRFSNAAGKTSEWFWDASSTGEEKKRNQIGNIGINTSSDWTPNEMDGIMDSLTYVLEEMQSYQASAHKVALEFMDEQREAGILDDKVAQVNKDGGCWDLREVAKDISADFLLGSLISGDEYPDGSRPILSKNTYLGPTTDMFLGSLSSFLGGMERQGSQLGNGNLPMDSKLRYLEDVQAVSSVCKTQIRELESILSNQGLQVQEFDNELSNEGIARALKLRRNNTMTTQNSIMTYDVEDKVHPPLDAAALSYIRAARDKLSEYSNLAQSILKDEVRCMVSEYTCTPEKCGNTTVRSEKQDGLHFEPIRKHFYSDAYSMDFKSYLAAEVDNEMQMMLLNTLHSSLFLRNVGDKCQQQIRLHVGKELSVSICNVIMGSIMNSKEEHRITEWGACLFKRHVQALHAYVYEFCRTTEGTEDLLSKVDVSSLDAPPMDPNWERLFSALDLLKLEKLEDYTDDMLHPLCTSNDARTILRLRTEFEDDEINAHVLPSRVKVDERMLG